MTDIENTPAPEDTPEDVNLDDFSADFFSAEKPKEEVKDEPEESEDESEEDESPSQDDVEDEDDDTDESDDESEESETPEESDDSDDVEEEAEPVKPRKKGRFQKRIDDMTATIRENERAYQAELNSLKAELAALKAPKPEEEAQNTKKTRELVEPTADDVDEDGNPVYPLGEFDPKLMRDLTRYDRAVEREHEAQVAAAAKAEQEQVERLQTIQTAWNEKVETAKTTYPDYVEKGEALLTTLSDIPADTGVFLTNSIMEMDYGPDVFYYLAEHPDEARAIVNSSPQKALTHLGRIEARFEIAADERSGKEKKLRTSKAPEPPKVRNKGSTPSKGPMDLATVNLDDFSKEFFK